MRKDPHILVALGYILFALAMVRECQGYARASGAYEVRIVNIGEVARAAAGACK